MSDIRYECDRCKKEVKRIGDVFVKDCNCENVGITAQLSATVTAKGGVDKK